MNLYQPTITGSLSVSGSVNISGSITIAGGGTISGTASIATTALTASSADNLLVRNTLTATTLVVQTVTSSVIYSSGSNVFGNSAANTQTFTGSVTMNPNGLFVSSSGRVGIGVISPASKLEINGFGTANSIMTQPIIAAYATNGFNLGSDGTNALIGVSNSGTDMVFLKRAGGEYSEAMRITSGGQIFMGTTSSLFNTLVNINYNQSTYEGLAISTDKAYNSSPQPNLIFGGKYNSSGNYRQYATIQAYKDNTTDGDSAASLVFYTNGNSASVTERMRISSAGLTTIPGGVKFGSGSSTLNYYEEGTFSPTNLSQNFDAVTVISGRYVRIGNQVTINCRWNVDANTTGMKYLVFDLPFAFFNNANINFTGIVSNYNNGASSASSNVGTSVRNTGGSTTQQYIQAYYTSTGTGVTLLFSMTYQTF
jgi:hypothetical protein